MIVMNELEVFLGLNEIDKDTINGETLFSAPSASLSFRGEGATVKLAEDNGNLLKVFVANKQTAGFNPFD